MRFLVFLSVVAWGSVFGAEERPRAREIGVVVGTLPPGPLNAITDVAGVKVGHTTLAAISQSAPTAQITSGGGIHPCSNR